MRTPPREVLSVLALMCLASCGVTRSWSVTSSSRADASVELTYEYGAMERPREDNEQGLELAGATCKEWGYAGAESMGGQLRDCVVPDPNLGCLRWRVTRGYQCVGTLPAEPASAP